MPFLQYCTFLSTFSLLVLLDFSSTFNIHTSCLINQFSWRWILFWFSVVILLNELSALWEWDTGAPSPILFTLYTNDSGSSMSHSQFTHKQHQLYSGRDRGLAWWALVIVCTPAYIKQRKCVRSDQWEIIGSVALHGPSIRQVSASFCLRDSEVFK